MKITPLEIRQKTFEKEFRGYEKEAVDAFLQSLSQEWERMVTDMRSMEQRLQVAEKDVEKLREVETSLYKALKTAEDTGANIMSQASKSAELQMKESHMKASEVLSEAKTKAKNLIEEAEDAVREINAELRDQIKQCESDFIQIESQRDNILSELKHIANDTLDRVNKYTSRKTNLNISKLLESVGNASEKEMELKQISESLKIDEEQLEEPTVTEEPMNEVEFEVNSSFAAEEQEELPAEEKEDVSETEEKKDKGSFFDDL